MFTKKTAQSSEPKLADVAKKVCCSGYIFDEINGDLGAASDEIIKNSNRIIMAYGYARRAAAAALYLQGHFKKESYDYVCSIFKSLQQNTEHSTEFQKQAFADAIDFMQTYHPIITSNFVKTMSSITNEYEVPSGGLDDDELIKTVLEALLETVYKQLESGPITNAHGASTHRMSQDVTLVVLLNATYGIDVAVLHASQRVCCVILDKNHAEEFILEELDGARQGHHNSQNYAISSGIPSSKYMGALNNPYSRVDGPDGPQQLLLRMCLQFSDDSDVMARFRCDVGKRIMQKYGLGVYAPVHPDTIAYNNSLDRYMTNSDVKEFELMMKCAIGDTSERPYVTQGQGNSMREVFDKALRYGESLITGQIDPDPQNAHILNHVGAMFLASKNDDILKEKLARAFNMELFDQDFMERLCRIILRMKYTPNNNDDATKKERELYHEIFSPVWARASYLEEERVNALLKNMGFSD